MVNDLCQRLRPERFGVFKPIASASIPILLADSQRQRGHVAQFTVELLQQGSSTFHPDPCFLGMTTLTINDASFHQSMQDVWLATGLNSSPWRGRWKITGRGNTRFATASLSGRSAEAAAFCTLLAARDMATKEGSDLPHSTFDQRATITATIKELSILSQDGAPHFDSIPLGPVSQSTIPLKLNAISEERIPAQDRIEMVLFCDGQDVRSDELSGPRFVSVKTVGEAFRRLSELTGILDNFRRQTLRAWRDRWAKS
jgi:hypothetical protein